jgi:autotransporter-associated beta strand protein
MKLTPVILFLSAFLSACLSVDIGYADYLMAGNPVGANCALNAYISAVGPVYPPIYEPYGSDPSNQFKSVAPIPITTPDGDIITAGGSAEWHNLGLLTWVRATARLSVSGPTTETVQQNAVASDYFWIQHIGPNNLQGSAYDMINPSLITGVVAAGDSAVVYLSLCSLNVAPDWMYTQYPPLGIFHFGPGPINLPLDGVPATLIDGWPGGYSTMEDGIVADISITIYHSGGDGLTSINVDPSISTQVPLTDHWTGTNSTNWADSGNWSGTVPGTAAETTSTDIAVFNQSVPNSPLVIDAGRNLLNIFFDTASVNSMTIGTVDGPAMLLTAGGTIQTTSTVVNPQTVNAPLVLEGAYTFQSGASSDSATLSFGGGITPAATSGITTLTLNGPNTGANMISGVLADNGAGQLAVTKDGAGLWILSGANTYSGNTTVLGGTLKFNVTSGTPTIAAGVTATVASGATLELAGSVSALGTAGGNRVHIVNGSTASGIVVSGTNQVVGGIDGAGNTQVNAGSDLTADHIIQSALLIGGTAGSQALVIIAASDASGNSLRQPSELALAGSLTPNDPFGAGGISSANLSTGGSSELAALSPGNSVGNGSPSSVPEPSTLLLVLGATSGLIGQRIALRHRARRNDY